MTKKMSGMKVKLYIYRQGTGRVLAGQRNASLGRSAESIDATSKDTEGFWNESLPGSSLTRLMLTAHMSNQMQHTKNSKQRS